MNGVRSLPKLIIEVEGRALSPEASRALAEARVQQRLSLPTLCELAFLSPPGPLDPIASLVPGASLRVGVDGADVPLFAGDVLTVEYVHGPAGEMEVRVRAYDVLHRLRKEHEARVHVQISLSGVAQELVAPLGLSVSAPTQGLVWKSLIQHGQSNLAFLTDLCERCGMYFTVRGDALHILTLEGTGESLTLALGESLLEARIEVNGEAAVDSFSVTGWNPFEVREYTGHASNARVGRRVPTDVTVDAVKGEPVRRLVGRTVEDTHHAELLAQAELDRHQAREVVFWGVVEGDSRLRPGALVELSGVAKPVEGRYVLTSVTHTVDGQRGFLSEVCTMPPARGEPETEIVATFGLVTRVDDPDSLGRIRASLPAYGEVETDWLQVVATGGGKGKGLLMIPDTGDRVLVLCSRTDLAHGVVVGGLFGTDGSPDSGVEDDAVRRYALRTSGGQLIQIDDAKQSIRLENSDGSFVELSPETVKFHAARDLEIEAPGKAVTIRGQSIDFERS